MALLCLPLLPRCAIAQNGSILDQADYLNQIYDTNAVGTTLAQAASVALFSGEIGDITNAPAPTDGHVYLTQSAIGQPIGGAPFAFYLPGVALLGPTNGTVFAAPASIALSAQAWQLAFDEYVQRVDFYALGATNGLVATVTNSALGTNTFETVWTNDVIGSCSVTAIATDNLGRSVTSGAVNVLVAPVIYVNGQYTNTHSFTFLATNSIVVTMTNPIPGGFVLYTTDGTDPIDGMYYQTPLSNFVSSVLIRAEITDADANPIAEVDPVSITILPLYGLTASTLGGGSIAVSPPAGLYPSNTMVTLTATPSNGWSFLGWTGSVATNATTFTLAIDGAYSEQAVFGTTLDVVQSHGGSVLVSPSQSLYPYGSSVLLTAAPSNNFYFQTWLNALSFAGSNSPAILLITNSAPEVLAGFVTNNNPNLFSLTVEVGSGQGAAAASPYATLYTNGASVTITATPAAGQAFSGWTGSASGYSNPLTVTMNGNKTILANFSVLAPPVVVITNPVNFAQFALPTNITIAASASDPNSNGVIAQVAFFAQATNQLGVVTNAPFAFVWTNATAGTNLLTAVALDNFGLATTSALVSVTVLPGPPVFTLNSNSYSVLESAGAVAVTVLKNPNSLAGIVNYSTANGTALAVSQGVGNYQAESGSLTFSEGQASATVLIPIVNVPVYEGNTMFTFSLAPSGDGSSLGTPSSATITIVDVNQPSTSNSVLTILYPSAVPESDASLQVFTTPAGAGGQWKLLWEYSWHNSGDIISYLPAGNYPVEFSPVAGYVAPVDTTNGVAAGELTVSTNNQYALSGEIDYGSLSVTLDPSSLSAAQWQLEGETNWHSSGFIETNLVAGNHIVVFSQVSGWITPAPVEVYVGANVENSIAISYLVAEQSSATPPTPLLFSTATTPTPGQPPYPFNGQLYTDVGYGSGCVVQPRVVLTAAHLVFNDATLTYAQNVNWFFQEFTGAYNPPAQVPAGWYAFSGYAAARTNDNSPGVESPTSQNLDVAALYFLDNAGRGGSSGYLVSDTTDTNGTDWLLTSGQKLLVGYPVSDIPTANIGCMYATSSQNYPFSQVTNNVFATTAITGYPGNSGGPLCVQITNGGNYYPAAVYLGGTGNTVVRAIDGSVAGLINNANVTANTGANHVGAGVVTVTTGSGGSDLSVGNYQIILDPPAAIAAGAGWKIAALSSAYYTNGTLNSAQASNYTVTFRAATGYVTPTNATLKVVGGETTIMTATYGTTTPELGSVVLAKGTLQLTISGSVGEKVALQRSTNLVNWTPIVTNTLGAGGTAIFSDSTVTNRPRAFYRAQVIQ